MSHADDCFIQTCRTILDQGYNNTGDDVRPRWPDGAPAYSQKAFGVVNRYDLRKEFPASTLRPLPLAQATDEILWIWQKKSNRVADLASHVWDAWALDDGTIGKAYGYQLAQKAVYADGVFDQVDRLLWLLRHDPSSRRMVVTMWNPADLHAMALSPCAYSLTLNVSGGVVNAILNQRSQDMLTASFWNVAQYAVLLHMLAQVSHLVAGELVHVVADAHIYDRHVPIIEDLIARPTYEAPMFWLNPKVTDFYAFTPEDVALTDYRHGPAIGRFPVAV